MLLVLVSAVALALLRIRWGLIFALIAGGVVGCGLAPLYACREMRKQSSELCAIRHVHPHPVSAGRPVLCSGLGGLVLRRACWWPWPEWPPGGSCGFIEPAAWNA